MSVSDPRDGAARSGPPATPRALIIHYLYRYRGRFAAGIALLAITNLLALWIPRLLKQAIDSMQTGGTGRRVAIYAGAVAGIAIVQSVVRTLSRLSILGASRLIVYDLRNRLFSHLQRLPLAYFRKRSTGDIVSRGINDVMLVRSFFGPAVMNLANTTLVYVGSIALMASMSPRLTLYALAPYPLLALGVNLASRRVFARSLAVQEGLAALTNKAQENITGMTLIKTYVREEPEAEAFGSLGEDYLKRNIALARARGVMIPLMGTMSHLGTLVVIFVGGASIIRNELTLGDFVAFNAYLAYLMWPTFALGWILNTFQRGWAALKRIGEILHEPAEVREAEGLTEPPFRGDVEFRSVSYAHAGAPRDILHLDRVSARAKPGEVIGILGTVGSGKTTLVSLVTRILEPPEGAVFVDGEDVLKTSLPRLRRHIAVVPQEPFLFSRSIRANVAYAPREFSEEEILAAVEFSRLSRDLPSFPRGLDTVVGERGFTLSGGQRQRATIGRAIITAPSILILDDPLSSVDAAVEEELLANLRSSARRRTVILISNRVAALAWADRILVMDAGRIVEEGTHADLAAAGGLYAGIARQQSLRAALSEMG